MDFRVSRVSAKGWGPDAPWHPADPDHSGEPQPCPAARPGWEEYPLRAGGFARRPIWVVDIPDLPILLTWLGALTFAPGWMGSVDLALTPGFPHLSITDDYPD